MIKRSAAQEIGANEIRALIILIFIVSLLAENCNFDNLRNENPSMFLYALAHDVHLNLSSRPDSRSQFDLPRLHQRARLQYPLDNVREEQ